MKSVFAIVVTFNRPERLSTCLSALLAQEQFGLKRIHVVVNSSDRETVDVIRSFGRERFITHQTFDNPGPAGGFYHGLQQFLSEDCEYVWMMDDDVVVENNCLRELLACAEKHGYIFPKVNMENGQEVVSFGWWGVLMVRSLVVKVGLPIPDLFFWAEDTEYLQNRIVHLHGLEPLRCKAAVVRHLHLRKKKRPSWYYYYVIRNTIYYRTYVVGFTAKRLSRTLFLLAQSVILILFKEDNKLNKLRLFVLGIYHGVRGKIGKLVDPALNK